MKHCSSSSLAPLAAVFLTACIGLLWATPAAHGQSSTLLGLNLRIHQVNHSGGFRTINTPGPLFEKGTGFGQSVGLELRYRASSAWGVSGAIFYNRLPGLFERNVHNPQAGYLEITSPEGTPLPNETERTITLTSDVRYATFSLEALGEWRAFTKEGSWNIGVAAGPTLSYAVAGTMKQTASILSPTNVRFVNANQFLAEENGKTIIFYEGDMIGQNTLRFGLEGGIFAEFEKLIPGVVISPGIFYTYGLTSITKTENWKMNMLTAQISLLMKL